MNKGVYVFYYLLTLRFRHPDCDLRKLVGIGLNRIRQWCEIVDPQAKIGLNIVLTNGKELVGSKLGRTLWHLRREQVFVCNICGKSHVHHEAQKSYRAIEIASEPISDDNWKAFRDEVVYSVDEDYYLLVESLDQYAAMGFP